MKVAAQTVTLEKPTWLKGAMTIMTLSGRRETAGVLQMVNKDTMVWFAAVLLMLALVRDHEQVAHLIAQLWNEIVKKLVDLIIASLTVDKPPVSESRRKILSGEPPVSDDQRKGPRRKSVRHQDEQGTPIKFFIVCGNECRPVSAQIVNVSGDGLGVVVAPLLDLCPGHILICPVSNLKWQSNRFLRRLMQKLLKNEEHLLRVVHYNPQSGILGLAPFTLPSMNACVSPSASACA